MTGYLIGEIESKSRNVEVRSALFHVQPILARRLLIFVYQLNSMMSLLGCGVISCGKTYKCISLSGGARSGWFCKDCKDYCNVCEEPFEKGAGIDCESCRLSSNARICPDCVDEGKFDALHIAAEDRLQLAVGHRSFVPRRCSSATEGGCHHELLATVLCVYQ